MKHIHVYVSGTVQGVFFRVSAKEKADKLGITGWIKNLSDGRVETVFEGEDDQINNMLAWCMMGPNGASVDHIEKFEEDTQGLTSFKILPTS